MQNSRTLVLQGVVDRIRWTLESTTSSAKADSHMSDEVLEMRIPMGYSLSDMGFVERFTKGRVLMTFPRE